MFGSGGTGSIQELNQWRDSFPLNASQEQQKAYLKKGTELLQGAIDALDSQYKVGMGQSRSVKDLITPYNQSVLDALETGGKVPVNTHGAQPAQPSPGQVSQPPSGPSSIANIPPAAIQKLRSNPNTRNYFDATFGAGAAAQVLGQ